MSGMAPGGGIGAVTSARLFVGTGEVRQATWGIAARATDHLHLDVFHVDDHDTVEKLLRRASDVRLTILADTDVTVGADATRAAKQSAKELRAAAGDGWRTLGTDPLKQHAKTGSRDGGAEGLVATDIADSGAVERMEVAALFGGAPAQALAAVHAAGADELPARLRAAAGAGILLNDPRIEGARYVTDGIQLFTGDPGGPLRIMTKEFDSEGVARRIADLGGDREIVTHTMPAEQQRLLRDAGVKLRIIDEEDAKDAESGLHGTIVDSGRGVLVTSAYLVDRVLHGSERRQSREAGIVLGGAAAEQGRAAYDAIVAAQR